MINPFININVDEAKGTCHKLDSWSQSLGDISTPISQSVKLKRKDILQL